MMYVFVLDIEISMIHSNKLPIDKTLYVQLCNYVTVM